MNRKIANQRQMIGELHIGYFEPVYFDLRAVQDEIELFAGTAARIRRQTPGVCIAEARRLHEQVEFVIAPIGVEITGDDDGF